MKHNIIFNNFLKLRAVKQKNNNKINNKETHLHIIKKKKDRKSKIKPTVELTLSDLSYFLTHNIYEKKN